MKVTVKTYVLGILLSEVESHTNEVIEYETGWRELLPDLSEKVVKGYRIESKEGKRIVVPKIAYDLFMKLKEQYLFSGENITYEKVESWVTKKVVCFSGGLGS